MSRQVGLNVLVADDRADDAAALRTLLHQDGHRVRVVADGEAALREVLDDPPEVLVLDINMPRLDGCDVAAAARSVAWRRRPLVVTVTGHDGDEYRKRAAAAGVDLYLVKPVDPDTIRAVLGRVSRSGPPA